MMRTVTELAEMVAGSAAGEIHFPVESLCALDEASRAGLSPFFRKEMLARAPVLPGAVLGTRALVDIALDAGVRGAVVHPVPVLALAKLIDLFFPEQRSQAGIHPTAVVHETATVHETVSVGPNAVVEANATIGAQSVIGPGAVVCEGAVIGRRVHIGPGAVIGYEGFGFIPSPDGPIKVRQVGSVVIEDDVEIGANACIDRATLGATVVGAGSKLDNLVQVGHNCRIGRGVLVAGQAGLAGSVTVQDSALIGGNAGIADHVSIGASARVAAKSGVIGDVPEGATVAGYPAMKRTRWLRIIAMMTRRVRSMKAASKETED